MITAFAPDFLVRTARNTAQPLGITLWINALLKLITSSGVDVITRSTITMGRGFAAP